MCWKTNIHYNCNSESRQVWSLWHWLTDNGENHGSEGQIFSIKMIASSGCHGLFEGVSLNIKFLKWNNHFETP